MTGVGDGAMIEAASISMEGTLPVDTGSGVHVPPRPATAVSRRVFDVVTALALLVATLPLLAVLALAIRARGGPVLFHQERVGAGGRPIRIAKLRTMSVDAERRLHTDPDLYAAYVANAFKLPADEDPRVTPFGRALRASSLDELPQLWSVLRGDMSMVGPRPVVAAELEEYTVRGAEGAYLAGRPGLTGLWQVSGRSALDYDSRIALDLEYLGRRSVWTDAVILLRTVPAVLRRTGAH